MAHPQLSEEMSLVTLEMRAGKRRAEALRNFAERTGEPEIRKLVAILIQNDRFGTSMGESLRNHSDFMRTRRRQEAEERAGKVGREAGVSDFLLYSAVDADCGGRSGAVADFQVPVPDDEPSTLDKKEDLTMTQNSIIESLLWLVAGGAILLFVRRRRSRRTR